MLPWRDVVHFDFNKVVPVRPHLLMEEAQGVQCQMHDVSLLEALNLKQGYENQSVSTCSHYCVKCRHAESSTDSLMLVSEVPTLRL